MISQKTRSTLTVLVGTFLILIGTVLIVALSSGYNFNIMNGELTSTGLVKLGTNPSGADIKVNAKTIRQKTPHQLDGVKSGKIEIEYNKQGYHDWQASFNIVGGEVTFADYALLIQKDLQQKTIESTIVFSDIFSSQNNNRSFAISNATGSLYEIQRNYSTKKILDLPLNASIKSPSKINLVAVNGEGTAVVLLASYPDSAPTRFWIDTNNGSVLDIDSIIGNDSSNIAINPRNTKEIFFTKSNQLQRLNTDSKTASSLPFNNVTAYSLDKDNIYTMENLAPASNGQFLVRYNYNGGDRYVLAQYEPASTPWQISLSAFDRSKFIALLDPSSTNLYLVRERDSITETSKLGNGVKNVKFNYSGKFLSYSQSNSLRTIDIEYLDRYSTDIEGIKRLSWATDYQMIIEDGNGPYIIDFNCFNLIKLPPNATIDSYKNLIIVRETKSFLFLSSGKIVHYSLQQPSNGLINFR